LEDIVLYEGVGEIPDIIVIESLLFITAVAVVVELLDPDT